MQASRIHRLGDINYKNYVRRKRENLLSAKPENALQFAAQNSYYQKVNSWRVKHSIYDDNLVKVWLMRAVIDSSKI